MYYIALFFTSLLTINTVQVSYAWGYYTAEPIRFGNSATPVPPPYTLTEEQAESYVNQIVAAFEYALRLILHEQDLSNLKQCILKSVFESDATYIWTYMGKFYNKDLIDQYILSGILYYIELVSYHIAYSYCNNQTIALQIATSMRNNALARINRHGYLDAEILVPFVGKELEKAIYTTINNEYTTHNYVAHPTVPTPPVQPQTPAVIEDHTYPSDECCICMEPFTVVRRIFMKPCGHDICSSCAKEWFFEQRKKQCPLCRNTVNLAALKEALKK